MTRGRLRAPLILLLLSAAGCGPRTPLERDLLYLRRYVGKADTLRGTFEAEWENPDLGRDRTHPIRARGIIEMFRTETGPRLRVETLAPIRAVEWLTPEEYACLRPDARVLERRTLAKYPEARAHAGLAAPLLAAADPAALEGFTIERVELDEERDRLRFVPTDPAARRTGRFEVTLDVRTGAPIEMIFPGEDGLPRTWTFGGWERNIPLDPARFEILAPPGTETVADPFADPDE